MAVPKTKRVRAPQQTGGFGTRKCPVCKQGMYLRAHWGLTGRAWVCNGRDCCYSEKIG